MLERCYSDKLKIKHPTYTDCTVCDEWLHFMSFKAWMEMQDWQGKELDKDILIEGNKRYSPETCVFVDRKVNTFILDCGASKGDLPIGVSMHIKSGKYQSQCNRKGKNRYLGLFETAEEAHYTWLKAKNEESLRLAGLQSDPRVAKALVNKYGGVIK